MKLLLVVSALIAFAGGALAQECSPENVLPLSDSCKEVGHTGMASDAEAECRAAITANEGYFILNKDVNVHFGSTWEGIRDRTRAQGRQTLQFVPFEGEIGIPINPLTESLEISSAAIAKAYCDRAYGSRLRKTCYAQADLSAKQYPLSCLKKWFNVEG
ncbi:hypothetical protein [Agrobacterium tumefaciens]|uniref:hypothetical protein n=1 Tax=Agrobacterium tumefaciens TaxID=358 RepID=UPI0022445149|nr:hypothetical protein [Agrobacterium tumefaciens]MCW8060449.1 hypothetical protein [Agrobacterium tumefaciens]MCW8145893.1 hypothetical protein [Agrobacterium tumefaciens]